MAEVRLELAAVDNELCHARSLKTRERGVVAALVNAAGQAQIVLDDSKAWIVRAAALLESMEQLQQVFRTSGGPAAAQTKTALAYYDYMSVRAGILMVSIDTLRALLNIADERVHEDLKRVALPPTPCRPPFWRRANDDKDGAGGTGNMGVLGGPSRLARAAHKQRVHVQVRVSRSYCILQLRIRLPCLRLRRPGLV